MEKRFETINGVYGDMVKDCETDKVYTIYSVDGLIDLLNEQDEKIKELEKYKSKYTDCLDKQLERENATHNCLLQSKTILDNLKQENQQLKQSQNSKAIEALESIAQFMDMYEGNFYPKPSIIRNFIQEQITELKEKK